AGHRDARANREPGALAAGTRPHGACVRHRIRGRGGRRRRGARAPGGGRGCMKHFAALYAELDARTATSAKLAALVAYFRSAPPADAAWALYFLAGGKPRQIVPTKRLRTLAREAAGLPEWLFDECYQAV